MSNSTGPLYESTYVVAADLRDDFESWLREFQRRSLQEPGIEDARGYEAEKDDDLSPDGDKSPDGDETPVGAFFLTTFFFPTVFFVVFRAGLAVAFGGAVDASIFGDCRTSSLGSKSSTARSARTFSW